MGFAISTSSPAVVTDDGSYFGTKHARDAFLRIFEQVRRKYKFEVVGYVVMPEHFHILIGEPMCIENRRCENRRTGTPDIKEQTRTEMTRIPLTLPSRTPCLVPRHRFHFVSEHLLLLWQFFHFPSLCISW